MREVRVAAAAMNTLGEGTRAQRAQAVLCQVIDAEPAGLGEARAKLAEGERRYDLENYRGSARKAPAMPEDAGNRR
jgi:hypothetical protein